MVIVRPNYSGKHYKNTKIEGNTFIFITYCYSMYHPTTKEKEKRTMTIREKIEKLEVLELVIARVETLRETDFYIIDGNESELENWEKEHNEVAEKKRKYLDEIIKALEKMA